MRTLVRLMGVAAAAATVTAMAVVPAAAPALADPPSGTTVHNYDLTGIGADTTQSVFDQFSKDYNAAQSTGHKADSATNPYLYSWDATNPSTGAIGDSIVLKKGCAAVARPDGSSAGIVFMTTENKPDGTVGTGTSARTANCVDFTRSARDRSTSDPGYQSDGVAFVALAGDAISYATQPGSNAPKNLSTHQLFEIYTCAATTWKQVGGKSTQTIKAFIPETGSGIRTSFLTAIGFTSTETPGPCVSDEATKADPAGRLQQNEGVNAQLNQDKANVIVPFSVGKYIAQAYHSAKCLKAFCKAVTAGPDKGKFCLPKKTQDTFGCDEHGTLLLNSINHTSPTKPWPLPKAGPCTTKCPVVNPNFTPLMALTQYVVVPYSTAKGNVNHIPPYLVPFFGPKGWICSSSVAKTDLLNYGFRVFGHGAPAGHALNLCGDTH
jgi:ABC-type phosphate transport system substrate-binding protein